MRPKDFDRSGQPFGPSGLFVAVKRRAPMAVEVAETATQSFPASQKVYIEGPRPDIRVPAREISLTPTSGSYGDEENPPLRVYDTSGPYTDTDVHTDIREGLPPLRRTWILERGDVEEYQGREIQPRDNGMRNGDALANMAV